MNKPSLFILLGVPGSGKSYFASNIVESYGGLWLNSDKTRVELYGPNWDTEVTDPKLRYEAVFSKMNDTVLKELSKGSDVFFDANNHKKEHRDEFRKLAESVGANTIVLYVNTPEEVSDMRAVNRKVSPYQNPTMSAEKLQKHKNLFEAPYPDEETISIDGTKEFKLQKRSFEEQLEQLRARIR